MSSRIRVSERDEKGLVSREFILEGDRVVELDEIRFKSRNRLKKFGLQTLSEIFLPSGFPESVTPDYVQYQIYDSLQAFSSSIASLLSSRAVLEGFGVGDGKASSTNAVLLSVVQDAIGRLSTILFAWKYSSALEPEAKMYRFAADIFNDSAFVLDCLSPALPIQLRVASLCVSGGLRAVCGVCGGASKAALSIHFAKEKNVGELNAKDSSQETVIGLLGMLCGSLVMSHVTSRRATWVTLMLLLAVHLWTNYLAVRSVVMTTLNRQRANIVYSAYRSKGTVLTPTQVSRLERIFELGGALRDLPSGSILGTGRICRSFGDFTEARAHGSQAKRGLDIVELFQRDKYFLALGSETHESRLCSLYICFKDGASPEDHLKAWIHTLECAAQREPQEGQITSNCLRIKASLSVIDQLFLDFLVKLREAGWKTSHGSIVTKAIRTFSVESIDSPQSQKMIH